MNISLFSYLGRLKLASYKSPIDACRETIVASFFSGQEKEDPEVLNSSIFTAAKQGTRPHASTCL